MARELLTAVGLRAKLATATAQAIAKNTRVRINDGDGLMLVVRPTGEASWVLRVRFEGKRPDFTIGQFPLVSIKAARDIANDWRGKIAKGVSPVARKPASPPPAPAPAKGDSVDKLMEDWLKKRTDKSDARIRKQFNKDVLPAIGDLAPEAVTREHIMAILRGVEARGSHGTRGRLRTWLTQMFEYGVEHEGRPNLTTHHVPQGRMKSFTPYKRSNHPAIVNPKEFAPLIQAIREKPCTPITRMALLLHAHVWQRPFEIRFADWSEFDFEERKWIIPAERMKMKLEHWVPLSRQVIELLRAHQKVVGDTGLLFPAPQKPGAPICDGTLAKQLKKLGYKGIHCPHGFRASARTILRERLKVPKEYMEKQLSHEDMEDKHAGAYDRAEYWDDRVSMMQLWSDWLDGLQ